MLLKVGWDVCRVSIGQEKGNSIVFNGSWCLAEESMVLGLPIDGHHCIVMIATMIAQTQYRRLSTICPLTLVELTCWLRVILINFARQVVQFRHCLNLNVVAPNFIPTVVINVVLDRGVALTVHECGEVLCLEMNVVHALLSHEFVVPGVAVDLMRYSTVQTVAIIFDLDDFKANSSLELLSELSFFLFILYLLELVSLEGKLSRVEALNEAVIWIGILTVIQRILVLLIMVGRCVPAKVFVRGLI